MKAGVFSTLYLYGLAGSTSFKKIYKCPAAIPIKSFNTLPPVNSVQAIIAHGKYAPKNFDKF